MLILSGFVDGCIVLLYIRFSVSLHLYYFCDRYIVCTVLPVVFGQMDECIRKNLNLDETLFIIPIEKKDGC